MGDKVKNYLRVHEGGLQGFLIGRRRGPDGPSLDDDGEGRPWTFLDESPLILPRRMKQLRRLARQHTAGAWVEAVVLACPEMGAWLERLSVEERGMVWGEARMG